MSLSKTRVPMMHLHLQVGARRRRAGGGAAPAEKELMICSDGMELAMQF